MTRSRARKGRSGHRDRKPITYARIQRPVRRAARRAFVEGGAAGARAHEDTLDAFGRRVLGLPAREGEEA